MLSNKEIKRKCFKLKHNVFENLNIITSYQPNLLTVLWNKHQIFIYYEGFILEEPNTVLYPEFDIFKLIVCSNHLICLDFSDNVHLIPLKLKNTALKICKGAFLPRLENIISIDSTADYIYSLKFVSNIYFVSQHKINPDLILQTELKLKTKENYENNLNNYIFQTHSITESEFHEVKGFLQVEAIWKQQVLILISFDKLSVYAFFYCNDIINESLELVKLYTCPTKICNLTILKLEHLSVLISLTIGSIIKIPLKTSEKQDIVHLNSAIYKLVVDRSIILYTDGINLWKAENMFKEDIKCKKLFLTNVKDFCVIADHLVCTTFNNLIYLFDNTEILFVKTTPQEYFSADVVFNNSDCIKKILEETEKSANILTGINKIKNYITILALSTRQDVMDSIVNYNTVVYESFEDILNENLILSLVDDIKEYFDVHLINFLIKITTNSLQQKFSEILSNVFGDLKVHVIIKSKTDILKTVTMTVQGQLKRINIVIPLKCTNIEFNKIQVIVKLITKIPGVLDNKQPLWVMLHSKDITLNSEHFIKTHKLNSNIVHLNNKSTTELILYENAVHLHGHLLRINKKSNVNTQLWNLYIKLPADYEKILKNLKLNLNPQKTEAIHKQITQDDFLKSRSEICYDVGHEVKLEIVNDGFSEPLLKISSYNLELAFNIKLFFRNVIYYSKESEPSLQFVNQAVYSSTEILGRALKKAIIQADDEEIQNLFEQYQKILSYLLI